MSNNAANVAAGKPKIGGALYWAPAGTDLPTDASTALASAFKCLGYISDDGLKNNTSRSRNEIKAWGGDTVLLLEEETSDSFSYTLIECTNEEALKHVYGSGNVEVTPAVAADPTATPPVAGSPKKISIDVTQAPEAEECVMVVEQLLRNAIKRIVIPKAAVKEVGEVNYVDNDVVGYETTVTALPVVISGKKVYHKEYVEVTA